jgi:hypothetical protein
MKLTPEEVYPVVRKFLNAYMPPGGWEQTYDILVHEQYFLLTEVADDIITYIMENTLKDIFKERTDVPQEIREHMENSLFMHRWLLRRCRVIGIPAAWVEFQKDRNR